MELVVGRIGRAHGVRGDLLIEVRTDEPERRFAVGATLRTEPDRGVLTVAAARVHSGRLLLRFEGCDDRGSAQALTGTMLVVDVDPDERPEDPEEFYDHQLEGLTVVTVAGDPVGVVVAVLHLPAQDVLVIERQQTGDEVLVPFVAAIVPEVDLTSGRIVVDPPPGLLDAPATEDS